MNKRLPYEEEMFRKNDQLLLPDENAAWEDMKRRLEEDDDRSPIALPLFAGCGMWLLPALILLISGWFFLKPYKWFSNKKNITQQENVQKQIIHPSPDSLSSSYMKKSMSDRNVNNIPSEKITSIVDSTNKETVAITADTTRRTLESKIARTTKTSFAVTTIGGNAKSKSHIKKQSAVYTSDSIEPTDNTISPVDHNKKIYFYPDSLARQKSIKPAMHDTVIVVKKDSSIAIDPIDTATRPNISKKKKKENKSIHFAAGLTMQFQLKSVGPRALAANPLALVNNASVSQRKLLDYIPSVYARMYKGKHWFLETDLRYRAPQRIQELLYSNTVSTDPVTSVRTSTSLTVTKTFNHQVSLSYDYFIAKNWSVGLGSTWNRFNGAIAVQTITQRNPVNQRDSLVSTKGINISSSDTNFKRSYFQAFFESQYSWRRFSVGLRFAKALQPYININLSGSPERSRVNDTHIFVKYELWRNKKR